MFGTKIITKKDLMSFEREGFLPSFKYRKIFTNKNIVIKNSRTSDKTEIYKKLTDNLQHL
jgi:hypothetical protein